MSYKVIPILRLEAIPFARLTVECQAQWEKEKARMPGSVPEWPWALPEDKMM